VIARVAFVCWVSLAGVGCAPARRAETTALLRAARAAEGAEPAGAVPIAEDPFVADLGALAVAAGASEAARSADPAVDGIPEAESAVRSSLRREARGDVSTTFVRRIAVRVAAPPPRLLAQILAVEAEKAALEADEAEDLPAPAAGVRALRVALLDVGQKPFRADYRWAFTVRTARRADGTVLVRYELAADPRTERVSLFTGVGALVPDGEGTRWVEAFAVGSPSSVPFFLRGAARAEVDRVFARRARGLAARAAAAR
jgi:hypothetical protein